MGGEEGEGEGCYVMISVAISVDVATSKKQEVCSLLLYKLRL